MAGKYGSSSITIVYDDGPGGSARTITQGVLEISGVKITSALEAAAAFGDSWEESIAAGMSKMEPLTIGGFWDTTATTGSHVVFGVPDTNPQGGTRTLVVGFGDSKTITVETLLNTYEVIGAVGKLTRFNAGIQPTGAATWA